MDSSRLRTGEIVAGIGGVALFLFLFFDWFGGGAEVTGNVVNGTATLSHPGISGWDALTDLPGFLIVLSGVAGIALAYLAAAGQRVNVPVRRGATTALLGALAVLLILWRMFAGSPTLKIGVFLGLAAAIAITAGALMALGEDGFQPLVAVAGGRTRAASASAPAETPAPPPAAPPAKSSSRSSGATTTTTKRSTAKKPAARSGSKAKKKSTSSRSSAGKRSTGAKKK
ncbi:MAG: hypothetical protein QOD14_558 [Solirubrobacterales bacterium]|nr:hypothetical protein [Solirubrobacterales bacterium]